MDKQIIGFIIEFMNRVQLQGAEVPAYNQCMGKLSDLHNQLTQIENENIKPLKQE